LAHDPTSAASTLGAQVRRLAQASGPPMRAGAAVPSEPSSSPKISATQQQIRGSALLLVGRLVSLVFNLATQVLIVRLLSKPDYGAFAYAFSVVMGGWTLANFGHNQVLTRFFALYNERRDYRRLFGTIVMEIATVLTVVGVVFAALLLAQPWLSRTAVGDPRAIDVLLVLVFLAPLEALDRLFEGILAVFSRPRAILVRKYLITPMLRLVVVAVLVLVHAPLIDLAIGYVATGAVGIAIYAALALRLFQRMDLLRLFRVRTLILPFRQVFGFAFPLLSTEFVNLSINIGSVILLGHYSGATEVATYRAIFPAAQLNQLVFLTFAVLFVPLATRMYARNDREGMRSAYWQTAAWIAVLTFPLFVLTCPLARQTTVTLFGGRYESSATVLALLSLGYYVNASLGFNALTLQTYGRLRFVFKVNVSVALLNLGLGFALIPRYGAVGAAAANASTLVLQNLLNQLGLGRGIGIPIFEWSYVRMYATLAGCAGGLAAIVYLLSPPLLVSVALAGVAVTVVVAFNRKRLEVESLFPELLRIGILRRVFA
jgi:O-antigen/teichoic acid export membrane protein